MAPALTFLKKFHFGLDSGLGTAYVWAMLATILVQGRAVSELDLALIGQWLTDHPDWSRWRLWMTAWRKSAVPFLNLAMRIDVQRRWYTVH